MNFSLKDFVDILKQQDIELRLHGDDLELDFPGDAPDELMIAQIRTHKSDLVTYLKNQQAIVGGKQKSGLRSTRETTNEGVSGEQKGIWMIQAADKNNKAYYIPAKILITGKLSAEFFEKALTTVVVYHGILRSSYDLVEGLLTKKVVDPVNFKLPYAHHILTGNYEEKTVDETFLTPNFDMEQGPLFQVQVLAFEDKTLLYFVIHHMIADHISINIFKRDLIYCYSEYARAGVPVLSALHGIKPTTHLSEHDRSAVDLECSRDYWREQFEEDTEPIELPFQKERPLRKTFSGATLAYSLDKDVLAGLKVIAGRHQTGLFALLLSSVQTLIYRYTQQQDLTLGVSIAGRDSETEDEMGLFAKIIPLRVQIDHEDNFRDLAVKTQILLLDGLEHQAYGFGDLIAGLDIKRNISRSPLFDVMVDYIVTGPTDFAIGDLKAETLQTTHHSSKYDLTFTFKDDGNEIILFIEYNTDLFTASDINRFSGHYQNLIYSIAGEQALKLNKLMMLSQDETDFQLTNFLGREVAYESHDHLIREFRKIVTKHPHKIAVTYLKTHYTFLELDQLSDRFATYLNEQEITKNMPVAIMMERSERTIISVLAVLKAGAAFLPVDPALPAAQIAYIISNSETPMIITEAACLNNVPSSFDGKLFAIDLQMELLASYSVSPAGAIGQDDLAYILYTSGSTGNPKGVKVNHGNLLNYAMWAKDYYVNSNEQICVGWFTAFSFDLSLTSIFVPLLCGGELYIFPEQDLKSIFKEIESHNGFSLIKMTPSHVNYLSFLGLERLPVERIILGGETLSQQHMSALLKLNPLIQIFDEYGPTETTVGCTVAQVSMSPDNIGLPIANTQIYILNDSLKLMPLGAHGEICVGGLGVTQGYLGLVEMTNNHFISNPFTQGRLYKTGDTGKWNHEGKLVYVGRKDSQVKVNGYRIELGQVARCLEQLDGIEKAEVLLKNATSNDKTIIAFFKGDHYEDDVLKSYMRQHIADYMVPSSFKRVSEFPLTRNGKLNSGALLNTLSEDKKRIRPQRNYTPIQLELLELFERVLGTAGLSADENLFDAGLNSLKAVKAQSMLEDLYPGKFEIHDIFSHASVEKLAILLEDNTNDKPLENKIIEF